MAEARVGDLLHVAIGRLRAAGAERPRLDAELILGSVTGLDRTAIVAHPEMPVPPEAQARFEAGLARREKGEPVAYIRGTKEFFGLAFRVDRRALIPRPETERLVELAEREVVDRLQGLAGAASRPPLRIVDIGTGSGAIPIVLASLLRGRGLLERVEIQATDESPEALALADENVRAHDLAGAIRLAEADLLPAGELVQGARPFDLVLANLPYIASADIPGLPVAASFEPRTALDGGPDGLDVIRRLLILLPRTLAGGGVALLEIGGDQEALIREAVSRLLPGWICRVERDLSGLPRVACVERAA